MEDKKKFTSGCSSNFCKNQRLEDKNKEVDENVNKELCEECKAKNSEHNHEDHNHDDCENHNHDDHKHHHHGHSHTHKSHSHHDHAGHDHSHNHGFTPNGIILSIGLVLTFFSIFNMFDSAFSSSLDTMLMPFLSNVWYQFAFATLILFIMGIGFAYSSILSLKEKDISEDLLVSISFFSAWIYSTIIIFVSLANGNLYADGHWYNQQTTFFNEAIEVASIIYLGRFVEEWLTAKLTKDMSMLDDLIVKTATVLVDGNEVTKEVGEINIGDVVVVKLGGKVPLDGEVIEGETTIDESMITGESIPLAKTIGSSVYAGTIASDGRILVKVTKLHADSFVNKIVEGVKEATKTKPESQKMADKIAGVLIPVVLVIAIFTFIGWAIAGAVAHNGIGKAIEVAMTVLVVACPCSFALTTPMSVLAATTRAKKESIIFNSKELFERIEKVDIVAFDKTGTLTEGKFSVINHTLPKEYIDVVYEAEKHSNHPIAKSIVGEFESQVKTNRKIDVEEIVGRGLKATVDKKNVYIGSHKYVKDFIPNFEMSPEVLAKKTEGKIIIFVFNEKELIGYVELADKIKTTTKQTLARLMDNKIDVVMITGDSWETARFVANELGIKQENVYADVDPLDKSSIIKGIQDTGKKVAFVGDGVNDSIALKQSDIGIAIGSGSEAAIETADVVLNKDDLELVVFAILLSKKTLSNIKRGFAIAIGYNVISVPLAMSGVMPPSVGATIMVLNDSVALLNAMTLSWYNVKK